MGVVPTPNPRFGRREYRGLRFEHKVVKGNFQGIAQMNYTDESVPYTRIVEHGHFQPQWEPGPDEPSVITYEYPVEWEPGQPRYYPINNAKNNALYQKYREKIKKQGDILVGGRLGFYKYMDMDSTVAQAISFAKRELDAK